MFNKTDKSGYGRNDQDTVQLSPTNNSLGASFLFREIHMKRWFLGLILVLIFALATAVFAFGPECGMGGPPLGGPGFAGPHGPGFHGAGPFGGGPGAFQGRPEAHSPEGVGPFGNLKLSKEQAEKLRGMEDSSFQETRDLRYDISLKCLEMQRLFSDPKVNEATLIAKQKELSSIRQKLMDKMDRIMIEERKILTPEQIQKLDRMPGPSGMGH
jgi:Spy/CpxP family protein refolding chaperone